MNKIVDIAQARNASTRFPLSLGSTVGSNRAKLIQTTWATFVERFRDPVRTGESMQRYLEMSTDEQAHIKDVGWFIPGELAGNIRKGENLLARWMIAIDFDYATPETLEKIKAALEPYAYLVHSTHKHTPKKCRFRLLMPLSRTVNSLEYQAIGRRLAQMIEIDACDQTGFQFARVMHFPSVSADGEYIIEIHSGDEARFLDPDDILDTYEDYRDRSSWPVTSREKQAPRDHHDRPQDPLTKTGVVGAFCRTYTIEEAMERFIPDVYSPGQGENRYTFNGGSGSNGAVVYDQGKFLYSNHSTDPCSEQNVNAFDMVRLHLFARRDRKADADAQGDELPSFRAMAKLARDDTAVAHDMAAQRHELHEDLEDMQEEDDELDAIVAPPELDDLDLIVNAEAVDVLEDQTNIALRNAAVDYKYPSFNKFKFNMVDGEYIKSSIHNLVGFLECLPKLQGCIELDLFSNELRQMRDLPGMPGSVGPQGLPWSDEAELAIKHYLDRKHKLSFASSLVHEACVRVAAMHAVNRPLAWMSGLVWDGKPRLEQTFIKHLGAEDSPYVRAVTTKWFCGAVARLLRPGCQFDYMIVFEGIEGKGKSRFCRTISKDYFTDDMAFGYDSKEVVERTANAWIVEISEMVSHGQASSVKVKAFISRRIERTRLAYQRNGGSYARHFVLVGTTNETDYLRGVTGNRRFWPVATDGKLVDFVSLEAEIDQIWAEAKHRLLVGHEKLYLEDELLEEAKAIQQSRVEHDDWRGTIAQWLKQPISASHWEMAPDETDEFDAAETTRRDRTCVMEIWRECLHADANRLTQRDSRRITEIMASIKGWSTSTTVRLGKRYGRTRGFLKDR